MNHAATGPAPTVPFGDALRFWAWLGCVSFGGPAAQIATLHEELVVRRRWLAPAAFDHALDFCMLLPGPEAQQLATWCGHRLHGVHGGLAAGVLFVLPAAVVLFLLSWLYAAHGTLPVVAGALWGMKAVVVALVLAAALRVGRRALRHRLHAVVALAAFALLLAFAVPFPWLVLGGAVAGLAVPSAAAPGSAATPPAHPVARTARILAVAALLWGLPLAALLALGPPVRLAVDLYLFFSGAACVTFGGAYAVLAYVTHAAVHDFGWLAPTQAIDGLALAETTPGPLIMVLQFVGFMAGWNRPGELGQLAAAGLGAAVTTWATFLPSMVFVFLGAPWIDTLPRRPLVARALAGVTAVVLGVLVHLAVVFGRDVLWPPHGPDGAAVLLTVVAFLALVKQRLGVLPLVLLGGALGALRPLA